MGDKCSDDTYTCGSIHRKIRIIVPSDTVDSIEDTSCAHDYTFIHIIQSGCDRSAGEHLVSSDVEVGKTMIAVSPGIYCREAFSAKGRGGLVIRIEEDFFRETASQYTDQPYTFKGEAFKAHPELLGVIRCFLLEKSDESQSHGELLDHLEYVIAHLTALSIFSEINRVVPLYDRFEVEKAISYMNDHLSEKITLEDLADQAHCSTAHFSKIFRTVTSQTPVEFLQSLRLQSAREMLSCDTRTISQIALECGFSTPSYFSSVSWKGTESLRLFIAEHIGRRTEVSDLDSFRLNSESWSFSFVIQFRKR